ncbi:MAG: hypothetical protein JST11_24350 [Acidobacteria bacterium]|nr:hypothetical protein [Acidobacteriota bacterium]
MPIPMAGALCRAPSGVQGVISGVVRNARGEVCLMSCSHVLASSSTPSVTDVIEWWDPGGQPPAWQRAGTLWKWVRFTGGGACNNLDVALAVLNPELAATFDGMPPLEIAPYDLKYRGAPMAKFNTRSGRWQDGRIQNLFVDESLPFDAFGADSFNLCGLIQSQVPNSPGDSGAIVLVQDGPLGIHIAGDTVGTGWAIPLERAFDAWGLQMVDFATPGDS